MSGQQYSNGRKRIIIYLFIILSWGTTFFKTLTPRSATQVLDQRHQLNERVKESCHCNRRALRLSHDSNGRQRANLVRAVTVIAASQPPQVAKIACAREKPCSSEPTRHEKSGAKCAREWSQPNKNPTKKRQQQRTSGRKISHFILLIT